MVVTLGQQDNVGEKPTVILYTYINRHAGTPDKKQNRNNVGSSTTSNLVVIVYCFIGYKDEASTSWYQTGLLGCGSFVRGRKRKKGDSIPFILSRRDYMPRLPDECP